MTIEIRNCALNAECNERWEDLAHTYIPNIRHCTKCDKNVRYVETNNELRLAIEYNYCVALDIFVDPENIKF